MSESNQQSQIDNFEEGDFDARRPSWASPGFGAQDDNEERSYSRKRSIECSAIQITIVDTDISPEYTIYIISVSCGMKKWIIKRRYRDFYYLDKELKKKFPNIKFPPLPPKVYLRSSNDPQVVDQRKDQLENYINELVLIQQIWIRNDLVMFLNDESNLMTFIWNFERMRRLQDLLKSSKIENAHEAAKLNSDLESARGQINELQSKISHMEMMFLQQAAGVASEQFPSSVLRSLSGVDNTLSQQLASELTTESVALYLDNENHEPFADKLDFGNSNGDNNENSDSDNDPIQATALVKALNLAQGTSESIGLEIASKKLTPDEVRTYEVSIELQQAIRISNELFDKPLTNSPSIERKPSDVDFSKISPNQNSRSFTLTSSEESLYSFNQNGNSNVWAAWVRTLVSRSDEIIDSLIPSLNSLTSRHRIFTYARDLVCKTLGLQLFPIGSLVSRTYLPDCDIDATIFVPKLLDDSLYVKINEALCLSAFNVQKGAPDEQSSSRDFLVSNVSFINNEIKFIRSIINGISVDLSTNQLDSLLSETIIERVDAFVGKGHLFKRSVLLLKTWFVNESSRYTLGGGSLAHSKGGRFSTWSIIVMLIWIFNKEGEKIFYPIQALGLFLRTFNAFDWASHALSVFGPVSLSDLSNNIETQNEEKLYLPSEIFDFSPPKDIRLEKNSTNIEKTNPESSEQTAQATVECAQTLNSDKEENEVEHPQKNYKAAILNVIDPLDKYRNLLESVDSPFFESVINALSSGYKDFQVLCEESSKVLSFGQFSDKGLVEEIEKLSKNYFFNSFVKYSIELSPIENTDSVLPKLSSYSILSISQDDLKFSMNFGRVALGGFIDHDFLTQLILLILEKKGSMPVGEVGKNLQAILACESLSRRLKDQFTGLKRAIESANHPSIIMGSEHPFNPVVSLGPVNDSFKSEEDISLTFDHKGFIYFPYHVQIQFQAQLAKDSQQNTKSQKSYRRPAPQISETSTINSDLTDPTYNSKNRYNNNRSNRANHFVHPNSPGRQQYFMPQPIPIGQMPPGQVYVEYMGVPPPTHPGAFPGYPNMPIYPHPIPYPIAPVPYFPPQMHSSLPNSLSSSYGGPNSPLSQSPVNNSYIRNVPHVSQQPQQSHSSAPNNE